jgi:hypothetical protein
MTHRANLTDTQRRAHGILDRVSEGQNVPAAQIRWALRILGDS